MKKLFKSMILVSIAAMVSTGCGETSGDDPTPDKLKAPTIIWVDGDIDAVHDITESMSVKIEVDAPAGIEKFMINIESPILDEKFLETMFLSTSMDLAAPATPAMSDALKELGFPVGDEVKSKKAVSFDISTFIPLIAALYPADGNHDFKLTVTDTKAQTTVKTLKFRTTLTPTIVSNNDADLWANTATFKVTTLNSPNVQVEYKRLTASAWQKATLTDNGNGIYTAAIAPSWQDAGTHASGVAQYTLNAETGIFAGSTYEYRLLVNDVEVTKSEFSTITGSQIANGNMNIWSKYIGYNEEWKNDPTYAEYVVDYPNPSAENAFWSNGNNAFTKELCSPVAIEESNFCARMKGNAMGMIFAAGNLFSGRFDMEGMAGFARFGQVYEFAARPSAIKVRYKATINTITMLNPSIEQGFIIPPHIRLGDVDPARILVCITNWSDRHSVHSGLGVMHDAINVFDPVTDTQEVTEGPIIAYGSKMVTETVGEWTELTIPLVFKDKTAKPEAGKYSLVISCASSAYGDYLCGNVDNEMYVDDFEWIY